MMKIKVTFFVWTNLCFIFFTGARKTVDVLPSSGLDTLNDNEILRIFASNKSNESEEFFSLKNHSEKPEPSIWDLQFPSDAEESDIYDDFVDDGFREINHLLEIIPEFSLSQGNISNECRKHSEIFSRELRKMSLWALKMYDATAKIPSGLLSGNVNQFGDFDECLSVKGSQQIRGQYCLVYLKLDVDQTRPDLKYIHRLLHSHYAFRSNLTDPGHRVPRFSTINWSVCIPASCSAHDVEIGFRTTLAKYNKKTGLNITIRVDREMCQVHRSESLPLSTIIVSFLFAGVVITSIVAAVCERYYLNTNEFLLSFSLTRNFRKLVSLKRREDDIEIVHGIRAINAFMLILAHKSIALFFNPYVNRTRMTEYLGQPWTVLGRAASLYTDPFIMLSGLLTSYSFVKQIDKSGRIDVKTEYLSRALRLIPTLGALILFCTFVMPFIGSGPQWNLVVTHHAEICKKTWWRNLLFIHNYFGFEQMCLTHTHHVGIDTQLFVLSPLMILTLCKWPKFGGLVLGLLATLSTVLRFYVTYYKELSNYVFFGTSVKQLFETADLSYILPSHRLTVYIIGIFMGYLLRRYPKGFQINKTAINLGWILSSVAALGAFLGPAKMGSLDYVYNPIHAAMYNAFSPIGWCAIFAWMIFICHTNSTKAWLCRCFSWRGFLVSTRLSYAIYLTQFPVFFFNVGQTRTADNYDFFRMQFNINEFIWIILTAAILTLLFDSPFQNIKTCLLKKKSQPTLACKEIKNE